MVKRSVAKKVRIVDITNGRYFPGTREKSGREKLGTGENVVEDAIASFKASYVITPYGEKVSRANVLATVTDRFFSPEGNYATVTLDDGTDAIRAKAFGEDTNVFEKVDKGHLVIVVGKLKEYQGEVHIVAELARAVEPEYENFRKLELLENLSNRKRLIDNLRKMQSHLSEGDVKEYAKSLGIGEEALEVVLEKKEVDYKPKILEIINSLDDGDGVEITKLFEIVKLSDNIVERSIDELLAEGALYEPTPGRFKKI